MKRKISQEVLFLSGVIIICFGFLLFHINPYWGSSDQDFGSTVLLFFYQLLWRPIGTLGVLLGGVLIFKGLKK